MPNFESLPSEIQMEILSYLDLVKERPARDLLRNTAKQSHMGLLLCCGLCEESFDVKPRTCSCHPRWRHSRSTCECFFFSHPMLAVNRTLRTLGLETIYRDAVFDIGPNDVVNGDDYASVHKIIRRMDKAKTERVRNLQIILRLSHGDLDKALARRSFWKSLLNLLRRKYTREDVMFRIVLIPFIDDAYNGNLTKMLAMLDDIADSLQMDDVLFEQQTVDWFGGREAGCMNGLHME